MNEDERVKISRAATGSLDSAESVANRRATNLISSTMPTVSVDKEDLWERLGQKFCTQMLFIVFRDHLDLALSRNSIGRI